MKNEAGALLFSARNGHLDIVKLLIENGMNVTNEALNYAAKKNGKIRFQMNDLKC